MVKYYKKGLETLQFQDVVVHLRAHKVTKDGVEIALTPKEYELLVVLIQNREMVLYREELFEKVWQTEYVGNSRTLDLHIQRLRKKLALQKEIRTIFRMGYMLTEKEE